MKRIVRLTESDLTRIVRRVISEQEQTSGPGKYGDYFRKSTATTEPQGTAWGVRGGYDTAKLRQTKNGTWVVSFPGITADSFNKAGGSYSMGTMTKHSIPLDIACGAEANLAFSYPWEENSAGGSSGWSTKPDGPLQRKATALCKTKGETMRPAKVWRL